MAGSAPLRGRWHASHEAQRCGSNLSTSTRLSTLLLGPPKVCWVSIPMRVATRTISALADGASTRELDELSIRTAAGLIVEEPNYSKLASRLLATVIDKEVRESEHPVVFRVDQGR